MKMHTYINYNNAALLHCPLGVTELSIEIEGLFLINKNKLVCFSFHIYFLSTLGYMH